MTMLHLIAGLMPKSAPISYTYNGSASNDTAGSTITLSGVAIGAAASGRLVVMAVSYGGTFGGNLTSATIGGISATVYSGTSYSNGGDDTVSGFIAAVVPTGTTATVVLTFSSSTPCAAVASYSIFNYVSTTPFSGPTRVTGASQSARSGAVSTANPCVVLAVVGGRSSTATCTWTGGVTEDADFRYASNTAVFSAASARITSAAGLTATSTMTASILAIVLSVITFQ